MYCGILHKMEAKFLYPIAEIVFSRVKPSRIISRQILRSFVTTCVSPAYKSWDIGDDELDNSDYTPSYRKSRFRDHGSEEDITPSYPKSRFRDRGSEEDITPSYHKSRFRDRGSEEPWWDSPSPSHRRNRFRENDSSDYRSGGDWRSDGFDRGRRSKFAGENLRKVKWDMSELQSFRKNFFTPSENMNQQTPEEVENFRKMHEMTLKGSDIPNPIMKFSDYEFSAEMSKLISSKGFENPSPIQSQGWPIALSGRDMIGIAKTGSGKTLGYILPCITHINDQPPIGYGDGPIALVMGPTRELVQQIDSVAQQVGGYTGTRSCCVFGGASKTGQGSQLKRKPSLIIATPGRLLDFMEMGAINMRRLTFLVLDEADRMLDMGFEPQIRRVVSQIRPDRQTLMWSATWPSEVQMLAADFLTDPIQLNVGSTELMANPDIEQQIEVCDMYDRKQKLVDRLEEELAADENAKILIFAETKREVDWLERFLNNKRIDTAAIHGDYSQGQRDRAMGAFRRGLCPVLVATDVASRGLDVDGISLVVNYEFPRTITDYIHRIGRTGRAGKKGKALSFFTPEKEGMAKDLVVVLKKAGQDVPEELLELNSSRYDKRRSYGQDGYGGGRYSNRRRF